MRITVASDYYEENGLIFLKCKECLCFKEKNFDFWYKHNEGFLGVLGRCKDCIKKGRRTERELVMARERDKKRYRENEKRRKFIFEKSKNKLKERSWIYTKTQKKIKSLGIRPDVCPICLNDKSVSRIEAHHFDYNCWHKICFACSICHSKLDKGEIEPTAIIDLLNL